MASKPLMFSTVTAEEFQQLGAEIEKEAGFSLVPSTESNPDAGNPDGHLSEVVIPNEGTAEAYHVKIGWTYNEEKQALAITIISKPFFIPEDVVSRTLWEKVSAVLATVRGD